MQAPPRRYLRKPEDLQSKNVNSVPESFLFKRVERLYLSYSKDNSISFSFPNSSSSAQGFFSPATVLVSCCCVDPSAGLVCTLFSGGRSLGVLRVGRVSQEALFLGSSHASWLLPPPLPLACLSGVSKDIVISESSCVVSIGSVGFGESAVISTPIADRYAWATRSSMPAGASRRIASTSNITVSHSRFFAPFFREKKALSPFFSGLASASRSGSSISVNSTLSTLQPTSCNSVGIIPRWRGTNTTARARIHSSLFTTTGEPNMYTFCTKPIAPRRANSFRQLKMTREPKENPTRVMGLIPRFRSIKLSARTRPVASALARDTAHGLSTRALKKDLNSLTRRLQHLRLPVQRVDIAHNRIDSRERQTDIIHFARHPTRHRNDKVHTLVVVQRPVFESLDSAGSSAGTFHTNATADKRTSSTDKGRSTCTTKKSATSTDHRSQHTSAEAYYQPSANSTKSHDHQSLGTDKAAPIFSSRVLDRASYTESATSRRKRRGLRGQSFGRSDDMLGVPAPELVAGVIEVLFASISAIPALRILDPRIRHQCWGQVIRPYTYNRTIIFWPHIFVPSAIMSTNFLVPFVRSRLSAKATISLIANLTTPTSMLVHTRRALSVVVDLHTGVAFPCAAKARVPIIILRGFVVRLGKNLAPVIVDTMFGESRHVLPLKIFFVGFVVAPADGFWGVTSAGGSSSSFFSVSLPSLGRACSGFSNSCSEYPRRLGCLAGSSVELSAAMLHGDRGGQVHSRTTATYRDALPSYV
ncbi:hypothetical protein KC320_g4 [Hortaea werneckii]|nr:hypothetical protein KC320_g4 [Hortaea werneckii]